MLEKVVGNKSAALVLRFMELEEEGYGRSVAKAFGVAETPINNQFKKFEKAGLFTSHFYGKTKVYRWDEKNYLVKPLRQLIQAQLRIEKETAQKKSSLIKNQEG